MGYKLKKIVVEREVNLNSKPSHESFIYQLDTTIDFPFIAGELNSLIPASEMYSSRAERLEYDTPLFNENGLAKIVVNVGANGIYYLFIRPGFRIKEMIVLPDEVVPDIYFGEESLIYSFYNPSSKGSITITAKIEKDNENFFGKLQSDPKDIIMRQYFINRAIVNTSVDTALSKKDYPINMTVEQVADYLNFSVKTIKNWTSSGKIPKVKFGGSVRYNKEDIDKWISENKTLPKSKSRKKQ